MSNSLYNFTSGVPVAQSRGTSSSIRNEFALVGAGFDLTQTALAAKAAVNNQVWTGTHDFTGGSIRVPTPTQGDNSTNAASTAYADAVGTTAATNLATEATARIAVGTTAATNLAAEALTRANADTALANTFSSYAPLTSPALTGTPTVPTAVAGTGTTQIASTAFVMTQAFSGVLPGQGGNAGKFVTTDGSNASWATVFPAQTGNAGKFISTDGINTSWVTPPSTPPSKLYFMGQF